MEPVTDRVRRWMGIGIGVVLFAVFLGGVGWFGSYVGGVIGTTPVDSAQMQQQMILDTPQIDAAGNVVGPSPREILNTSARPSPSPAGYPVHTKAARVGITSNLRKR